MDIILKNYKRYFVSKVLLPLLDTRGMSMSFKIESYISMICFKYSINYCIFSVSMYYFTLQMIFFVVEISEPFFIYFLYLLLNCSLFRKREQSTDCLINISL